MIRTPVPLALPSRSRRSRATASTSRAAAAPSDGSGVRHRRPAGERQSEGLVPAGDRAGDRGELGSRRLPAAGRLVAAGDPEIEHRVGGEAEPRDAVDEAGRVGERDRLRRPLGQVRPERVVEAPRGGRGALAGGGRHRVGRRLAVAARRPRTRPPRRGSARSRRRPRRAPGRAPVTDAARPEEEPDGEADGAAERDVLDAQEPDVPADRLDDVVEDHERDRERGLARGERDRRRREPGDQDGDGEKQPEHASRSSRSARAAPRRRRTRPPCRPARGRRSGRC